MRHLYRFCILAVLVLSSVRAVAQTNSSSTVQPYFLKGDQAVNLSVGFLNASDMSFSLFEATGAGDPSPSVQLAYEYGLLDRLSISGFLSYYRVDASTDVDIDVIADQIAAIDVNDLGSLFSSLECIINPSSCATTVAERVNVYTTGGKLRYTRTYIDKLDTYVTTYLGYSINRRKTITESALDAGIDQLGLNTDVPTVIYYGGVGARYFLTDSIGMWGEFGYGNVHLFSLGLSYRW